MKSNHKALLLLMCAVLLVATSAFGTLAYLTDSEAVTNTFTVGSVGLELDEAKVKPNGSYATNHDNRVQENEYHLIPGHTYYKDPTVTVKAGSAESYIRMLATFNFSSQLDEIFAPGKDLTAIFAGYDSENWALNEITEDKTANTRTYEFRYVGNDYEGKKPDTVQKTDQDIILDDLFESFTVPGEITKEQLATLVTRDTSGTITDRFTITVVAHAIQADGFDNAEEAWTAFDTQNP